MGNGSEKRAGYNFRTPLPRDENGLIKWKQTIATIGTIVTLLGGGTTAAVMNWPGSEDKATIARLEAERDELAGEVKAKEREWRAGIEKQLSDLKIDLAAVAKTVARIERRGR